MERFLGSSNLERSMQSSGLTQQWTHMSIVIKNCTCRLHRCIGKADGESVESWTRGALDRCQGMRGSTRRMFDVVGREVLYGLRRPLGTAAYRAELKSLTAMQEFGRAHCTVCITLETW
jgi:hypothetical protein